MGEKWEGEKESSSFPSSSGSAIPVFGSLISLSGLFAKIALHLLFGWSLDKDKKSLDQSKQFL